MNNYSYISWKPGPRRTKRFHMNSIVYKRYENNNRNALYNNSVNAVLKGIRMKRLGTKRKNYKLFDKYETDIQKWIHWKKIIMETPWKILVHCTYKVFTKHMSQKIAKNFKQMYNLIPGVKKRVRRLIIANYSKFYMEKVISQIRHMYKRQENEDLSGSSTIVQNKIKMINHHSHYHHKAEDDEKSIKR